ncbi:UNVERIFIED_CONTAM: hypothetical protein HDU68_008741 [Siphonaria sp. JEL0065]|nr:hypothetical protein HDU68_008741 [Siphonaria sp. JEL0065]
MGRSEFADPPMKLNINSVIAIQCNENPVKCLCGDGDYRKPNAFVVGSKTAESYYTLSGTVILAYEPKLKDPNEAKPQLEISFTGREHLDLSTTTQVTTATTLPPPKTKEFLKVSTTQPWKERINATAGTVTEYEFTLSIPNDTPPSALPSKGAIDYRIEAKFHLPEHDGYDELVAQKRVEVVRTHMNFQGPTVAGSAVDCTVVPPPNSLYKIAVKAPEYAFIDSGSIPVTVSILQGDIKKIHTVVVSVEERRKYSMVRRNEQTQKLVRSVATDEQVLGEKVVTNVGDIQKAVLDFQLKFGNGVAGAAASGKIPMLVHPTFSGEMLFVSHVLTVKLVYGDNEVAAESSSTGGMIGLFKKLTHSVALPGVKDEEFEVRLLLRTGVMNS